MGGLGTYPTSYDPLSLRLTNFAVQLVDVSKSRWPVVVSILAVVVVVICWKDSPSLGGISAISMTTMRAVLRGRLFLSSIPAATRRPLHRRCELVSHQRSIRSC